MTLSEALAAQLNATTSITNLIGTRSYPSYLKIDDKTFPLIVFKTDNEDTIQAYSGPPNALQSAQIVFHCIGQTYADAAAVGKAIQAAFNGFSGTWGTVTIQGCFLDENGIQDDVENDEATEAILYYIKELTFTCWWVNQ